MDEHYKQAEISAYLQTQLDEVQVKHAERVKVEWVGPNRYEVWDVHERSGRLWVVLPPMNFYVQDDIPTAQHVLSLHIGLMERMSARLVSVASKAEQDRFSVAHRKLDQARRPMRDANEPEDYQTVGVRCREALLAIIHAVADDTLVPDGQEAPKQDAFRAWSVLIADTLAPGRSNERLRAHLKGVAATTWQLVVHLQHDRNASRFDAETALDACGHVFSAFALAILRHEAGEPRACPACGSMQLGDYWQKDAPDDQRHAWVCGACGWTRLSPLPLAQAGDLTADP